MKKSILLLLSIVKNRWFICLLVFVLVRLALFSIFGDTNCKDGWRSQSIGIQGACSHHGGVDRTKGMLIFFFSAFAAFIAWSISGSLNKSEAPASMNSTKTVENENDPCPLCESPMRVRKARKGKHKGKSFLGCANYPACKGIRNLDES